MRFTAPIVMRMGPFPGLPRYLSKRLSCRLTCLRSVVPLRPRSFPTDLSIPDRSLSRSTHRKRDRQLRQVWQGTLERLVYSTMKLLIVDDSAMTRVLLKRNCLMLGVREDEILEADNGQIALERFAFHACDAVITDWHMPVMDGLTLVKEIRKRQSTVPILMVTSERERQDVVEAIGSGVNDYLIKPFAADVVKNKLSTLVTRIRESGSAPQAASPDVAPAVKSDGDHDPKLANDALNTTAT